MKENLVVYCANKDCWAVILEGYKYCPACGTPCERDQDVMSKLISGEININELINKNPSPELSDIEKRAIYGEMGLPIPDNKKKAIEDKNNNSEPEWVRNSGN